MKQLEEKINLPKQSPRVTILMSVYNCEEYLNESIQSILDQTFTDYEFLIIDDGSTDSSPEIIARHNDIRIRNIKNDENIGLTKSLNIGLTLAKGEYIVRMDADDISLPQRLKTQVDFMDKNPHIGACGSWISIIGQNNGHIWEYPINNDEIVSKHLFECSIAHPSVIIRKGLVSKNLLQYNPKFIRSQDYEFWVRISTISSLANIGTVLLKHRIHPSAVGQQYSQNQKICADEVRYRQLRDFLGLSPSDYELMLHNSISNGEYLSDKINLIDVNKWFLKIWNANLKTNFFNESTLFSELGRRWYGVCKSATIQGFDTWIQYRKSPFFSKNSRFNLNDALLFFRCFIRN